MKEFDVVILTESRYLNPDTVDDYIQNVLTEDELLKSELESLGLKVSRKDWSDLDFDWSTTRSAVFRTTWDYFDRFSEFKEWLSKVESLTQFFNPISQIKWNMDKWYLNDLRKKGIHVVETIYIKKGEKRSLRELVQASEFLDIILKPTIAGAARHTYKINVQNVADYQEIFEELIQNEDFMIQPFQYNITEKGEISFMVIDGKFTHAILKKARPGDFRVQDDFGGTVHSYIASKNEIEFAEEVVRACNPLPAYARVDVMWDNENRLAVSEVELVEPELWFRECKEAARLLAKTIAKGIQ
ncbi:MAG: hypothetical protein RLN81_06590 [Balneolaceae bacterium]